MFRLFTHRDKSQRRDLPDGVGLSLQKGLSSKKGFTLVEMIVAVGLFAIVMVISVEALLSLVSANRKAQALQSVMNNLSVSLDGMVRTIRAGTSYSCIVTVAATPSGDCAGGNGGVGIQFEPYGGNPAVLTDQVIYTYIAPAGTEGGYIQRSRNNGSTWERLTAPEVSISDMRMYIVGTTPGGYSSTKSCLDCNGNCECKYG